MDYPKMNFLLKTLWGMPNVKQGGGAIFWYSQHTSARKIILSKIQLEINEGG